MNEPHGPEAQPPDDLARRTTSFAQGAPPGVVDRLGRSLSLARMRRLVGPVAGTRAADVGCGYDAGLGRRLFADAATVLCVDIAVDPFLADDRTTVLTGYMPDVLDPLADESLDAIVCNNVLEHLDEPHATLRHLYRLLAPGGVCVINVPSWRGKVFLELAAFRLGIAPAEEMNDHRRYYDPRDLWPDLVAAGFAPQQLYVRRHKGGLNTIARCRKP